MTVLASEAGDSFYVKGKAKHLFWPLMAAIICFDVCYIIAFLFSTRITQAEALPFLLIYSITLLVFTGCIALLVFFMV